MGEDDDEVKEEVKPKGKTKMSKYEKEEKLRWKEQKDLEEDIDNVDSKDGYERLILRNPNSSFLWIRYVAFTLESEDIKKARVQVERALKVINFQNEQEKLNLWLAYINLEFSFGEETKLIQVFQRALAANNPLVVYRRMIELYKNSSNWAMVDQLSRVMVKKFKYEKKAWKFYLSCEIERVNSLKEEGKPADKSTLKEILSRSFNLLSKA